jgi:hypothetical protein
LNLVDDRGYETNRKNESPRRIAIRRGRYKFSSQNSSWIHPIELVKIRCGAEEYDGYFCHPANSAPGKWRVVFLIYGADAFEPIEHKRHIVRLVVVAAMNRTPDFRVVLNFDCLVPKQLFLKAEKGESDRPRYLR